MAVERHDWGHGTPVCIGQWCCGCPEHPIGKPWGWNSQAWVEHYRTCPRSEHHTTWPKPETGASS